MNNLFFISYYLYNIYYTVKKKRFYYILLFLPLNLNLKKKLKMKFLKIKHNTKFTYLKAKTIFHLSTSFLFVFIKKINGKISKFLLLMYGSYKREQLPWKNFSS